ncbi:MAG: histidine kinase [Actinomycetota bacterium]
MILSLVLTAGVFASVVLAAAMRLELSSPWAIALIVAGANGGLLLGLRLRTTSGRTSRALPQRRMVSLVEQTLPHMRIGLNEETASRTVQLLHDVMRLDAVAITDRERVLAFTGPGSDHHRAGDRVGSGLARRAMDSNQILVTTDSSYLGCSPTTNGSCPLTGAVVAPLVCDEHPVGSLAVYQSLDGSVEDSLVELTKGLAGMLSLQLELAQAHREAQVAEAAKLDALRAQINPHFLFNTLNTISMKARTDSEEARRLLVRLSDFLRYAMKYSGHAAPFGEEYFFVRTYLFLEKARFGDRLRVRYDVDPQCLSIPVPVLTIQPLVENAVKHGIAQQPDGGLVELRARMEPIGGILRIKVTDNGVGIEDERLSSLMTVDAGEISALANIYERLTRLYGGRASFEISSTPGKGTSVSLGLPVGITK